MKHYIEVSTSDSETAFMSSPDALPREIFCFQIKYVQILMRPPVRLWRQTATDCDRRNLFLTTIVRCVDNTCEGCDMMPKSAGGGPVSYRSGDICFKDSCIARSRRSTVPYCKLCQALSQRGEGIGAVGHFPPTVGALTS